MTIRALNLPERQNRSAVGARPDDFCYCHFKPSRDARQDSFFRDDFDLLEFRLVDAKKLRHFDHLIGTNKVRRIGEKLLHARSKFAAPHCLGKIHADAAGPV